MRVLKQICLLIIVLVVFTVLLCCSKETRSANSNLVITRNVTNQNAANSNSNVHRFDAAEFERNKNLWNSKNIENYKMIVEARSQANLSNQVLVEVENRKAKSIKNTSETDKGSPAPYKYYDTVEKIFKIIEGEAKAKAKTLNVDYDKTLGYPLLVIIDERKGIADDEMSVEIKNLEVNK